VTKKNILYGDLCSSILLIALGIVILRESSTWVIFGTEGPGPGFFPLMYGAILVVLSLYLLLRSFKGSPEDDREPLDRQGITKALTTWAALAVSVPLMVVLGFMLGFGLVAFFMIRFVFERSYRTSAIVALSIAVVLHLLFPVLLEAPLPPGMLWGF